MTTESIFNSIRMCRQDYSTLGVFVDDRINKLVYLTQSREGYILRQEVQTPPKFILHAAKDIQNPVPGARHVGILIKLDELTVRCEYQTDMGRSLLVEQELPLSEHELMLLEQEQPPTLTNP